MPSKSARTTTTAVDTGGVARFQWRPWADLNHDLLVSIFSRLRTVDLVVGAPLVCSSWQKASRDPSCWLVVDLRDWLEISRRLRRRAAGGDHDPDNLTDLLNFCVDRGNQLIDKVYFPDFAADVDLSLVAARCPRLLYFSIDNPIISVDGFCEAITKLHFLKGMAVNESLVCLKVLEQVNKCCPSFSELMIFGEEVDKYKASVICENLPHLRKLEMQNCLVQRQALLIILDSLKDLEYLDISGRHNSGITSLVLEKASQLKVFRWESMHDEGEFAYCSYCDKEESG